MSWLLLLCLLWGIALALCLGVFVGALWLAADLSQGCQRIEHQQRKDRSLS